MKTTWNLGLLYKSHDDPQIEKDMKAVERAYAAFEKKYRTDRGYLKSETKLVEALRDYESLFNDPAPAKGYMYFSFIQDLDASDSVARAKRTQILERLQKNDNRTVFFELALAKIPAAAQKKLLKSKRLAPFRYFLKNVFERAKHDLSEPEEKILGLKRIPAYEQWVVGTEKLLNRLTIDLGDKKLPIFEALSKVHDSPLKERRELHEKCMKALESISEVAESEINAIVGDKKIGDELRGFKEPYDQTILGYQNDRKSVLALVDAVTDSFGISHRFYELKAKLLKLPSLEYSDRAVGIGENLREVPFEEAVATLRRVFGSVDERYLSILDGYLEKGQIDVYPRVGKTGGAYCSGNIGMPTYVLLNYTKAFDQVMTFAHEMGHAIHTEMSKPLMPLYQHYSTSTAEVASTLFESFVFESVFETLSDEEKVVALHKRINDDIQTIFRQIACFNFEADLHRAIREKGEISKDEIRSLMNEHMSAYLGPAVRMKDIDGNFFVQWSHIRRFFYVYSYAFGQLISKALYAEYKKDKGFLGKINRFLSAGGTDSPENIFKSIGIDVTKPDFWKKGLRSIEKDIERLEKLTKNR
ncbi:MAG: M3 family oligoendopeptidase [Candidatus Taylorbacteria bacterium]|nr:M3 family oligoendopeptidase [Candidatus Taylorbacteria bacterium]